jgi:hypothetical protein
LRAGGTGLQVSGGNLGVIVDTASKKFALVAGGAVSLVGITGFSVSGGGSVRINKLGSSLNETLSTPAGDVVLNFPTTADVLELQGSVSLAVGDFITGSATLAVQKETSADLTTLLVKASAVTAFLGTGSSTADAADDMGVRLTNGGMDLRILKNTASGSSSYAFAARGTAELVGIPSITASGTIVAQKSTTAAATVLDFGTPDPADDLTVQPGTTQFGGSISLAIAGFTTLSGHFGVEKETVGSTTKIKLAATNVNAFLGSNPDNLANTGDEVGAQISNARLGAVLYRTSAGNSYAIDAAGTAALVGIDGLTLSGSLSARINTTGGAVSETITVPGGAPVQVSFAADEDDAVFSGTVTADAGGFASLSGGFSISKSSERLKIAAAGVTAFVGAGDTGLRLTDGSLGVIVNTSSKKFAMVAGGTIALEGVSGFSLSGSGAVRINKLGAIVDEVITTPAGDVRVKFDTDAEVLRLSGSASMTIADFISGSATLNVEKTTLGDTTTLLVQASEVTAFLGAGASTADAADDMGVRLANGGLDLRVQKNTATNTSTYAFGARVRLNWLEFHRSRHPGRSLRRRAPRPQRLSLTLGPQILLTI